MVESHVLDELRRQVGFFVDARVSAERLIAKAADLREQLAEVEDELKEQVALQEQASEIANRLVEDIDSDDDVDEVRKIFEEEMSPLLGMLVVS